MNPNLRRRLKYVAPLVVKKVSFENLDRKYVGLEHIESWTGRILYDDLTTLPEGTVSLFEPNDVLFGKLRPYLAKVSLVDFSGACSTEALVLRPKTNQWPPFVRYVLSNGEFIDDVNSSTFGAKMPRASWEFIGSRTVPVPDLPTQKAIADFLDRETARIDQLIEKKQRMVEVLGSGYAQSEKLLFGPIRSSRSSDTTSASFPAMRSRVMVFRTTRKMSGSCGVPMSVSILCDGMTWSIGPQTTPSG